MCFNADGSGSSMVADPMASAFLVEEEDALQMKLDMFQCRCGCTIAILAAVETFDWKNAAGMCSLMSHSSLPGVTQGDG